MGAEPALMPDKGRLSSCTWGIRCFITTWPLAHAIRIQGTTGAGTVPHLGQLLAAAVDTFLSDGLHWGESALHLCRLLVKKHGAISRFIPSSGEVKPKRFMLFL